MSIYTIPVRLTGASDYGSGSNGLHHSDSHSHHSSSSFYDRLPRSSSASSYRSSNFDRDYHQNGYDVGSTRTVPRRLGTSSLARPLGGHTSRENSYSTTNYQPSYHHYYPTSSKPPLPSSGSYGSRAYTTVGSSTWNRRPGYSNYLQSADVYEPSSYAAHRYGGGSLAARSSSIERRPLLTETTFDRLAPADDYYTSAHNVDHLAKKFERLSTRSSDSGYTSVAVRTPSPVLDDTNYRPHYRQPTTVDDLFDSGIRNGFDAPSANGRYVSSARIDVSNQSTSGLSSVEDLSAAEIRDQLTSMVKRPSPSPASAPVGSKPRFYKTQANSMPDVVQQQRVDEAPTNDKHFRRHDAPRSSGSSVDSSQSSSSSTGEEQQRRTASRQQRLTSRLSAATPTATTNGQQQHVDHNSSMATRGMRGLNSIGNTCFMNSMLQCLSHTRPLLEFCLIDYDRGKLDINNNTSRMKGALMRAFVDLLQHLWLDGRTDYISPDNFKAQIQKFAPRFVGYQQQDSQEFLRYLLQGLHEDVNRVRSKPKALSEIDDTLPDDRKAAECWKRYLRTDDSAIVDLFVGQLKSELRCLKCGHVSTTFDPFWDLSLPIPSELSKRGASVSVEDCLAAFTREETLDGDEMPKCERCNAHRPCAKKFSVHKFPRILVLHLKRFSGERYRSRTSTVVNCKVSGLDLSPFASKGSCNSLYDLYAVSNHSGSPTFGHYTANVKHAYANQWLLYDDTRVSACRNVVTCEAYVLFYELSAPNVQESSRL